VTTSINVEVVSLIDIMEGTGMNEGKLKRELGKWHGYALMIGGMIGAGIFVVTGEAGAAAGPSVPFGYVVLLPVLLASALSYVIYLSTPLGQSPGGAYIHISRTFNNHFVGFIFMWFQFIALLGVMAIIAISFGDYLVALTGNYSTVIYATALILFFFVLNLIGVKWFGLFQLVMSAILLVAIVILIVPGLFSVNLTNYQPILPHGIDGFLSILPSLFFAYFGFEQLAQAGGEIKDPQKSLPRTMLRGVIITMAIYFLISFVAFGVLPAEQLAKSKSAMLDVASVYLSSAGKWVVTIGIVMAFATTLNSLIMVVSRILFSFAEDNAVPTVFAKVNKKYGTPHISLILSTSIVLLLIWTQTMGYLLDVSLQGMFLMYIGHSTAMIALPFVRKELFESALFKPKKPLIIFCGLFSISVLIYFSISMILSVGTLLLIWGGAGAILFIIGKIQGGLKLKNLVFTTLRR
jgi:amino acid transporter